MIKYNANAPEIKDHPQYNVMKGFGVWCVVGGYYFSAWSIIMILGLAYYIFKIKAYLVVGLLFTNVVAMIFLAVYSFGIGWGIIKIKNNLPQLVDSWSRRGIKIFVDLYILQVVMCLIYYVYAKSPNGVIAIKIKIYDVGQLIVYGLNTALAVYAFWAVKKTFTASCIDDYVAAKTISLSADESKSSHPRTVTLFEQWDPLRAYGKFLFYLGLISLLNVVIFYCNVYSRTIDFQQINQPLQNIISKNTLLLSMGIASLVMVCGFGLYAMKEWARSMSILLHAFFILVPICWILDFGLGVYTEKQNTPLPLLIIICAVVAFPLFHWCYFVIRTLSSPVVKYVCLRGGYDID